MIIVVYKISYFNFYIENIIFDIGNANISYIREII